MANVERKNWRRRLKVPKSAIKGEIITIKTMAEHVMEPGVRRDPETGVIYPKKIIDTVICRFNGEQIYRSQWYSGVSANPFMSFKMKAITSGLECLQCCVTTRTSPTDSTQLCSAPRLPRQG